MPSLRLTSKPLSAPAPRLATAFALAIALGGGVTDAAAQRPGPESPDSTTWGLGLGVFSAQKPYTGIDRENKVLPLVQFENRYVRVLGPGIEAKLPSLALGGAHRLDLRLVGLYDGAGYEAGDAPVLAGMAERKAGFWLGAKVKWRNDVVDVGAEWLADASGHSKGQRFGLGLEKTWQSGGNLLLTPYLTAHWHDKKVVDYYYGVRASEARVGRPAYAGQSTVNTEAGVRAVYRFDAHQSVLLNVGVTRLGKEIRNSPLVDRSSENRVVLGYLYRF